MVHQKYAAAKLTVTTGKAGEPIESFPTSLFPAKNPQTLVRVTGVYIPPSRTNMLNMDRLLGASGVTPLPSIAADPPHLIGGDFNTTGGEALYLGKWACGPN